MSDLENHAKPYLLPMLDGKRTVLDYVGQTTLALWAMKIAMVLEQLELPTRGEFTNEEREQLRTLSALPSRTAAWLAAVTPSGYVFSARTDHHGTDEGGVSAAANTLVFGRVAIQLFTLRVTPPVPQDTRVEVDVRNGPWEEATIRLWPATKVVVIWPPSVALNHEIGINMLADRFSVTKLDSLEKIKLAV